MVSLLETALKVENNNLITKKSPAIVVGLFKILILMCNGFQQKASDLIYIIISNVTGTEFSMPQNLTKIEAGTVVAIEAYNDSDFTKTPEGVAVAPDTVIKNAFMTLETRDNKTFLTRVPLSDLRRANNNGDYFMILPQKIDFSKSKINIGDVAALAGQQGKAIVLRVIYIPAGEC